MSVTIGSMTSNVNVVDNNSLLSNAVIEQIVQRVMMQLRQEKYTEAQNREDREISNRSTTPDPF